VGSGFLPAINLPFWGTPPWFQFARAKILAGARISGRRL